MAQPKGHTGNPYGRPKGSTNRVTSTVRAWIVDLINANREQIESDLKALEPLQRLQMIEKLLPYILPREVKDKDVQGACYDANSITERTIIDELESPKGLLKWYEMEDAQV